MDRRAASTRSLAFLLGVLALVSGCSGSSGASTAEQGIIERTPDESTGGDPVTQTPAVSEPSVTFSADAATVDSGDAVVLTWRSDGATRCAASGGWSGDRPLSGSAAVGPLSESTTYTLSCNGDGGTAVVMLSVAVQGLVSLAWQAPTENVDGSPLTDLAGFRLYYGGQSRSYTDEILLENPATTGHDLTLASGSYYFAMKAVDGAGNESAFSNEVVKVVN